MELTIKIARNNGPYVEFLFIEETDELGELITQKYDLRIRGKELAKIMGKKDMAMNILFEGINYLHGLKTKWEVDGKEYKLIDIWATGSKKSKTVKSTNSPEREGMPPHVSRLLDMLDKASSVEMLDLRGQDKKDVRYEYDELNDVSIGVLNEKGREGWIVMDIHRDDGKMKSVLMMRKLK